MENSELLSRASQAARNYHEVYGVFPPKIGIHLDRLRTFPYTRLEVWDLSTPEDFLPPKGNAPVIQRYLIPIMPVYGPGMSHDAVYLPHPDDTAGQNVIRADVLADMAKEKANSTP